jgi:hypothetical protein
MLEPVRINDDQRSGAEACSRSLEKRARSSNALARLLRATFSFASSPRLLIARLIGKLLTRSPCVCSQKSQWCGSRASSCACN